MSGISSSVATTDFLNLLTIQLQNQDPIEPVNQENFIAQLSQFSMLEEMESLNSTFDEVLRFQQLSQGTNLVGKQADYTDEFTGEAKSGVVDKMIASDGPVHLLINGERVGIEFVSGVSGVSGTQV